MNVSDIAAIAGDVVVAIGAVVSLMAARAARVSADAASEATQLMREQQRATLVRDVNIGANRVFVTATQVEKLAKDLEAEDIATNWDGYDDTVPKAARERSADQCARAKIVSDDATALLASSIEEKSDSELASALLRMEGRIVQVEGIKEDIYRGLDRLAAERKERRDRAAAQRDIAAKAGGRVAPSPDDLHSYRR